MWFFVLKENVESQFLFLNIYFRGLSPLLPIENPYGFNHGTFFQIQETWDVIQKSSLVSCTYYTHLC
jgi:hypothetical protein